MKKLFVWGLCLLLLLSGCGMQTENSKPENTSSSTYEQTESATEKAPIRQDMDPLVIYICGIQSGILDEEGNPMESAPHPQQFLRVKLSKTYPKHFLLRKKK